MAFGVGMHRCLGSHYAKMMFQVMGGQVLKRLPTSSSRRPERFADGEVYAVRKLRSGSRGSAQG
ncbi:cytochrome P450 family protein [Mycobacterium xenopi 4042]|uniref:Cytochrome P450 family protein n=1 Tax=Mycobacterium xenopi 4042 TaxID=1299334 RepID=X8AGN8_MYCXE|nr:cytochrome P450 family protein [Mycobacterium xenopi 4042]